MTATLPHYNDGSRDLPVVTVQVEALAGGGIDEPLRGRVRDALRGGLGVNPELEILELGTLPRVEGTKARRVLDRRAARPRTRTATTGAIR